MKKLILIIGILLLGLNIKAQGPGTFTFVIVRDSLCIGDSCVKVIMNDTLVNPQWVRDYAESLGLVQPFDSLALNANVTNPDVFNPFTLKADTSSGTITMFTNEPDIAIQLAQEFVIYGRNITSTTMNDGEVVYIDSSGLDPYPVFRRAIADDPEIASATIGVATHSIETGTLGYITRTGGVTMDVSVWDENAILYASPVDSGQLVSYAPQSPYYKVRIGRVIQPGNPGILGVDVEPFTGNDTEVALDGFLNGIVLEKQSLRDTIISNVLYFETNNESRDTIDLPFMYQNEICLLNTTSGAGKDGRAQVALTYGTATSALTNYIYIDNSGANPVLAANTTGFTVDAVRLAECGIFDQTTHETFGFAYFQRFNNSINSSTTDGLMNRSVKRQRQDGSRWESGVNPTVSIITNGAAVDSLKVETTSGIIWQFNSQSFQAQDGKRYLWLNSPTGERWIGHLGEIDSTQAGIDLHGGNNRRYGLNIFAIQSSGNYDDFLAVNSPGDYYSTDESAIQDVANHAVTTVPSKYGKVTARLFRIVVNYSTASSGTLTNLLGAGGFQDERGQLLGIGGGGSGSGGAVTDFSDAEITIFNSADPTKIIDFDASNISTGNARTIIMADADIDLTNTLDNAGAIWNGSSITKTNSISSPFIQITKTGLGHALFLQNESSGELFTINNISTGSSFIIADGGINEVIIDTASTTFKDSVSFEGPVSMDGSLTIGGGSAVDSIITIKDAVEATEFDSLKTNELIVGDTIEIGEFRLYMTDDDSTLNIVGGDGEDKIIIGKYAGGTGRVVLVAETTMELVVGGNGIVYITQNDFGIFGNLAVSGLTELEGLSIEGAIETPFDEETYSSTLGIDFSGSSFKKVDLTGNITINITNLPEGVSTLVINQDGTGRTITIGTGWGTVADNQASLSTTIDAKNIVQFIYDGDDITYFVGTEGN